MDSVHLKEQFAAKLRQTLAKRGMKQNELARRMGLTKHAVSRWALGFCMPRKAHMLEIADILDVSPEWLSGKKP